MGCDPYTIAWLVYQRFLAGFSYAELSELFGLWPDDVVAYVDVLRSEEDRGVFKAGNDFGFTPVAARYGERDAVLSGLVTLRFADENHTISAAYKVSGGRWVPIARLDTLIVVRPGRAIVIEPPPEELLVIKVERVGRVICGPRVSGWRGEWLGLR